MRGEEVRVQHEDRRPHVAMLVRNPYTHDTRVQKEARSLVAAGYRVTVVADGAAGLRSQEDRDGTTVIRVERAARRLPGLRYLLHDWRLLRVLLRLQPHIIHAHDSNALLPVALAARWRRVPFVYDAHDLWLGRPRRQRSRLYFALNQAVYRLIERLLVPAAAAAITVSPPIARHLERVYGLPRVDLVPNYPDVEELPTRRDLRTLTDAGPLHPDRPIALYLGGLMAGRGLENLVDAAASFRDAQLVLLGSGALAEDLARRAGALGVAERVHLLSPVPSDHVVDYAADAQIGVSPIVPSCLNYRYSLPNKLFQYMAAGIPVVASDFPQVREVVEGAACGALVDTGRPDAIAEAVNAILSDPAAARAMGERGQRAVRDRFNWSVAERTLLDVYARVSSSPRSGAA